MEQKTLTRNESADLTEGTLMGILVGAPEAVDAIEKANLTAAFEPLHDIRAVWLNAIEKANLTAALEPLHDIHAVWLDAGLHDPVSLYLIKALSARLRLVGDAAVVNAKIKGAWRD